MNNTIADKIIAARTAAGLTQRQLADKIGVKTTTICSYETGRCDPPPTRWDDLAGALNLDIETIYRWKYPEKNTSSLPTS